VSGRRRALLGIVALAALVAAGLWGLGRGLLGRFDSEYSEPTSAARSAAVEAALRAAQRAATPPSAREGQILFGDLHVHTTISFDAFMLNLPVTGGQGAHTPADACDFARHCAALDFYSLNDHAANIHPDDWRASAESVRRCNARSGDPQRPDLVAFLGWEWTQAGLTPETHYGHKNVLLADAAEGGIPTRPVAASEGGVAAAPPSVWARGAMALGGARFRDLALRWTALSGLPRCPEGPVRELPDDCREVAETPADLFRRLDDWGFDSLVIPHGTTWGIYTPPGSSWDKQLVGPMHDPARQTLIEVYSGHGDSEVHRDWRALVRGQDGEPACPDARPDYLPMCRRAGQLVEERCLAAGEVPSECAERARQARRHAVLAGVSPHTTVPGATGRDWLDAGQCRDCDQPSFKYRPGGSAQSIAALGSFDEPGPPRRFRLGFIASSDIHSARPGTGYKESNRRDMTDAGQDYPRDGAVMSFFLGPDEEPVARSRSVEEARRKLRGLQLFETERSQSFLYTGGLVAAHSEGRSRPAIWEALKRRQVYGTSGPRILLWFDLLEPGFGPGPEARSVVPMGGEIETRAVPEFRVRAVGSLEQQPGCDAAAEAALGSARVARLCGGECYHPGDARRPIVRIEVVRIRPQQRPDEPIAERIDDPWLRYDCPPDPEGCELRFVDPSHPVAGRDALYYVRAFEPPTPTINGDTLRCRRAAEGRCLETRPCPPGDDCLAPYAPRAWSSPIYLDWPVD
jgi:hypothetical protein